MFGFISRSIKQKAD